MSVQGIDRSLFRYIWSRTRREQIWVLAVIFASMPAGFILLDLPKYIINGPIQGHGFETAEATQLYFHLAFDLPHWIYPSTHLEIFKGVEMTRLTALYALSGCFLLLVIISGLFKFYINTYKGQLGERMLQILRFELFERVLYLPLTEYRRIKPAEIATMIKDEVEPLGGFIGDAFVQPVFLVGQIITAVIFILLQNLMLGLITLGLVAVQGLLIPRLRVRQLELGRQRQLTARALAGNISEIVEDMPNVIVNDTFSQQKNNIAAQLNQIFVIRFALYRWKFFVKFLNNMIAQFTPFLFYTIGGYLAIQGSLDLGQLVAVIAAYRDLPGPVKELIDWDQERMDVEIKYAQVAEQFGVAATIEVAPENGDGTERHHLSGNIVISSLSVVDGVGSRSIENLTLEIGIDQIVAVVGPQGSGADALVESLARLVPANSGSIELAGRRLEDWPHAVTGKSISYVGNDTFFQNSTIEEALLYGLRHGSPVNGGKLPRRGDRNRLVVFDIDPARDEEKAKDASEENQLFLRNQLHDVAQLVDFAKDVIGLSLNERLADCSAMIEVNKLLEARKRLAAQLQKAGTRRLIEPFDCDRYSHHATIAENLLFGMPASQSFKLAVLPQNPVLRKILAKQQLDQALFEVGREIAETLVDLFDDVSSEENLMRDVRLINPAHLGEYRNILKRVKKLNFKQTAETDRSRLLEVAFAYIEPRDRLGVLTDSLRAQLLEVRHEFMSVLGHNQSDVTFHDPDRFNLAASIQDNVLFGRIMFGVADADMRVNKIVTEILEELDLHLLLFATGLRFNIGNGGRRLNPGQRQKLAMARAILKRPNLLIASRALSNLDARTQTMILENLLSRARREDENSGAQDGGFGIIWSLADPAFAPHFDRVIRFDNGILVEDSLMDKQTARDLKKKLTEERLPKTHKADYAQNMSETG